MRHFASQLVVGGLLPVGAGLVANHMPLLGGLALGLCVALIFHAIRTSGAR